MFSYRVRVKWMALIVGMLLGAPLSHASARAEGDQAEAARFRTTFSRRVLAGHGFLPSMLIPQPFVTSQASMRTGLGFATLTLSAQGQSVDLTEGALVPAFQAQHAIARWLAVGFDLSGSVRTGTNTDAAYYEGARIGWSVGGFVNGLVFQNDRFSIGVGFGGGYGREYQLSPSSGFDRLVPYFKGQRQAQTTQDLVNAFIDGLLTKASRFTLVPELSFAVGIFPNLGLFGAVQYTYERVKMGSRTSSNNGLSFGAGLSVDLRPGARVPLGLVAAYNRGQPIGDGDPVNTVETGVFYTGSPNIRVGVQASMVFQNTSIGSVDAKLRIYAAQFLLTGWF